MTQKSHTLVLNSLVGEGSCFYGDIEAKDIIRIDGEFHGNITSTGKVLIGKKGKVHSDIKAKIIVVGGQAFGTLRASSQVSVLATAKVVGDIITKNLLVEEGSILEGQFKTHQN